ncbi:MAG: DNA-3-methyladenine glycosylase [Micromonosporaceae bacterium]|nr:DNA-3-methyladenine glycosylase [Micromonosporaceae bacterium]
MTDLRALLAGPVQDAARGLLNARISGGGVTVRLTEVEAYAGVGEDPSSHAHRRQTARNAVMFGPPGFAYVYFTYGMHWCVNVVCGPAGRAAAVLLRAGEVVEGPEIARSRRPRSSDRDLARGPARLATVLGADRNADGASLLDGAGPLRLAAGERAPADRIRIGPRVGVRTDTAWRFWLDGEPTVSVFRRHVRRRTSRDHAR